MFQQISSTQNRLALTELQWGYHQLLRFRCKASTMPVCTERLAPAYRQFWTQNMLRKPAHVRMMNKAIDYLGRYASSRHKLGQILQRFAGRNLTDYDAKDIVAAIQQTIDQCTQLGYLDDREFAVTVARSQRRLGRSQAVIRRRLREHALCDDIIAHALAKADKNSADLGAMARAGFSMATSKQILDHDDPNTIDDLLHQLD
jgi:SOS response regulatory protein OraA/RecX